MVLNTFKAILVAWICETPNGLFIAEPIEPADAINYRFLRFKYAKVVSNWNMKQIFLFHCEFMQVKNYLRI